MVISPFCSSLVDLNSRAVSLVEGGRSVQGGAIPRGGGAGGAALLGAPDGGVGGGRGGAQAWSLLQDSCAGVSVVLQGARDPPWGWACQLATVGLGRVCHVLTVLAQGELRARAAAGLVRPPCHPVGREHTSLPELGTLGWCIHSSPTRMGTAASEGGSKAI